MAKTLIYAEGSTRSVKIGDTNTSLYLQIAQDNVNVDLATAKSINVKVRSRDSFVKTIEITSDDIQSIPGVIQVPLNNANIGGLPDGDYYFEVWVVNADDQSEIYPDIGVANFSIVNNVESGSIIYTSLTLQDFEDRFAEQYNKTEETYEAGQANMVSFNQATADLKQAQTDLANGGYAKTKDMNVSLATKTDLKVTATKADKSYVDTMISTVSDGSPKGSFDSINFLKVAYPSGTNGVFLVNDSSLTDGTHKFMWDSSASVWNDLGVYSTGDYLSSRSETIVGKDLNAVLVSMVSYAANNVNQPNEIGTNETYLFINYANKPQEVGCQVIISDSAVFKRNGGYGSSGNATWEEWKRSTIEMPVPYVSKDLNSLIIPSINFCVNNVNQPESINTGELYTEINYVNGNAIAQTIISQKNVYFRNGTLNGETATFENWSQLIPEVENIKKIVVDKSLSSPNGDTIFNSFVEAMKYAYSLGKKVIIHVKSGTYDIVQEYSDKYGTTYLDSTATEEGCYIGNGMHIIFEPDTQIICHYVGSNAQILSNFSPLTAKNSDFVLENVQIDSKNVRYSIHDDTQNFDDGTYYKHCYYSCELSHDNSANSVSTTAPYALGIGLGKNSKIDIKGGIYSSIAKSGFETAPISIHNSPLDDAKSNVQVRDAYLDGAIRLTWWGASTKITKALVSGCSLKPGIITHVEASGAGYDNNNNLEIISWNNDIHS